MAMLPKRNLVPAVNNLPEADWRLVTSYLFEGSRERLLDYLPEQANMTGQHLKWPLRLLASLMTVAMLLNFGDGEEKSAAPTRGAQRLREGTRLVDVSGRFEVVADRISFAFTDSGKSVRVLENLALDRVFRVLSDSQSSPRWTISGTITEYNGGNFLFLTKAVQTATVTKEAAAASGIGTGPKLDYPAEKEKNPAEKEKAKPQEPSHDQRP